MQVIQLLSSQLQTLGGFFNQIFFNDKIVHASQGVLRFQLQTQATGYQRTEEISSQIENLIFWLDVKPIFWPSSSTTKIKVIECIFY